MRTGFWTVLGVVAIAAAAIFWWWHRGEREESPEELANLALTAQTAEAQELAAGRLQAAAGRSLKTGKRNPAQPSLGRVLTESRNPAVRAECMRALAMIWDYEYMPTILAALDDDSPVVRAGAGTASEALLAWKLGFNPDAPPAERKAAIGRIQGAWKRFQEKNFKRWQERLEEKDKHPEAAGA